MIFGLADTDAEGRFVVGDGCSYLAREKHCTVVIDAATLTGEDIISNLFKFAFP